jgi:hypothetical protein
MHTAYEGPKKKVKSQFLTFIVGYLLCYVKNEMKKDKEKQRGKKEGEQTTCVL